MKFLLIIFLLIFSYAQDMFCAQVPRQIGSNPKFKILSYKENDVHFLTLAYGVPTLLILQKGESIVKIINPSEDKWDVQYMRERPNYIFINPKEISSANDNLESNITIITDRRRYQFELQCTQAKDYTSPELTYEIKMIYPEKSNMQSNRSGNIQLDRYGDLIPDVDDALMNYQYLLSSGPGSESILPIKVFDDNKFTYFEFDKHMVDMPAIFVVDDNGAESLVNFRVVKNTIVVEGASALFTIRSGSKYICSINEKMEYHFYETNTGSSRPLLN